MLTGDYQVVDVLMLVGNVLPLSIYFLVLGLVNSHSRPYLTTSRADFIALTCALAPVLLWPVPAFARGGMIWLLVAGLAVAGALFVHLLLSMGHGLVIYNISEARAARLLEESLRALGLDGRWVDRTWESSEGDLRIHLRRFALLRNVTLHIDATAPRAADLTSALGGELHRRLATVAQLPSTMGACLVLLGVTLMILPLWTAGRHIHDVVEAVSHLFG